MLKSESKNTEAMPGVGEVVFLEDEPSPAIESSDSQKAHYAPDILSAHLCLTAPDRDMVFLPMVGLEFQEDSCALYRGIEPKNTIEAMMATLAVGLFNASLGCIADGTRQNTPPHVRDLNLKHGIKAATAVADLLKTLHGMRGGSQKSVSVDEVNVEAGGQAIIGDVESGRQRRSDGGAVGTSRSRMRQRRPRSAPAEIV
jgi:hypothetical protein